LINSGSKKPLKTNDDKFLLNNFIRSDYFSFLFFSSSFFLAFTLETNYNKMVVECTEVTATGATTTAAAAATTTTITTNIPP